MTLPTLFFYDSTNIIFPPTLNVQFNNNQLDIQIIEKGHGLTKNTKLYIGKILNSITLVNGGSNFNTNPTLELVPKYYPKCSILPFISESLLNKLKLSNTSNPTFETRIDNFLGIDADFAIELETQFSDNTGNLIDYPKINDNYTITSDFVNNTLFFKIAFSLDNNENVLSNYPNDEEYLFPSSFIYEFC